MKTFAILCSGGDSQGMNACIKAFVNTCISHKIKVIGYKHGYQGLIDNEYIELNSAIVENIATLGGTILKTSRCEEFKTVSGTNKAINTIKNNNIDGLVVLGGDGSFKGAQRLFEQGINVICIPATIDNDLYYTDNSLGFDTAVQYAVEAIENMHQTMQAVDRTMVIKLMGRKCGDIALRASFLVGADSLAIEETQTSIEDIIKDIRCALTRTTSPVVIISEAVDYTVKDVENAITKTFGVETRGMELGYIQRGGAPSYVDRMLAYQFGIKACMLLLENKGGIALGVDDHEVFEVSVPSANSVQPRFRYDLLNQLKNLKNYPHNC